MRETSTRFILTVCAALLDWLIIAAAIYAAEVLHSIPVYAAAVVIIASRQHAIGVIAHEAIHWPKDRLQSAVVCTLKYLCAWPILMHFEKFRDIHLAHHGHLNTADDPDFTRNQPQDLYAASSLWHMLLYALGLNRKTREGEKPGTSGVLKIGMGMAIFWGAVIALMWIYGFTQQFLLYWALPLFTWFVVLIRLRGIIEHTGIGDNFAQKTRTTRGNLISNFLFLPHAIGMHGEHHRNPQLPWYRLRHAVFEQRNWHTSPGVFSAALEVIASTAWFKRRFQRDRPPLRAKH